MKSYQKFTKVVLAVLLLIAILFAVNYFSKAFFTENKGTKLVEMSLPAETQNLIMNAEVVKLQKGKGVDSVVITGWVIRQNVKEKKKDVYMVLKSLKETMVFELGNSNLIRPDVTKYFHLDEGIDNHGFEMSFPRSLLKDSKYQIGFIIDDKSGKSFAMSSKAVSTSDDTVSLIEFVPDKDSVIKSNQVSLNLKAPTSKMETNFELIKISDNNLIVSGWGFLQGLDSDSLKTYLLLKKNDKVAVFSVEVQVRKDVTIYFKKSGINLDASGFTTQIPTENLEKGHFQVGLYIEKGNHTGITYAEKYVDID